VNLLTYNVLTVLKRQALPARLVDARPKRLRFEVFAVPDLASTQLGPVHLPACQIQSDSARITQPCRHKIFQPGTVQIGPPNPIECSIGEVHFATGHIQSDSFTITQSRNEILDP